MLEVVEGGNGVIIDEEDELVVEEEVWKRGISIKTNYFKPISNEILL